MKLLLFTLCFIFSSVNVFSQPLSKTDFNNKMLTVLGQQYNVAKVPDGFSNCAYSIYKKDIEENGKAEIGFVTGVQVAQTCMLQYFDEIVFSDGGKKLRNLSMVYFEEACINNIKPYENQIYVNGYCSCLRKSYDENDISLKTLVKPSFAESEIYQNLAIACFKKNQKN